MLEDLLHPAGVDLEILQGRNDTRFSQKVRNLKSHGRLTENGWAREVGERRGSTIHEITDKGRSLYESQKAGLLPLFSFELEKTRRVLSRMAEGGKVAVLTDETVISEGGVIEMTKRHVRQRSRELRDAAIEHYTKNGYIECSACSFEFSRAYGPAGKKYIEIHHLTPICEYEGNVKLDLARAIENVAPLCANCHRVVHLHNPILAVEEVRNSLRAAGVSGNRE